MLTLTICHDILSFDSMNGSWKMPFQIGCEMIKDKSRTGHTNSEIMNALEMALACLYFYKANNASFA